MESLGDRRATILGFVVAVVLLAVVFSFVGIREIARTVSRADTRVVAVMVPVAVGWLTAWGLALGTVLAGLDVDVTVRRAFLTYAAATFANNVTPFGQAGGEPLTAFIISRSTDADYETGLAAIASVDALHFVPTLFLAGTGLTYFATRLTFGRRLTLAAGAVVGFALVVPALGYVVWRFRRRIEGAVVDLLAPLLGAIDRVLPDRDLPNQEVLRRRVRSFFLAIRRVADDRPRLAKALAFSTLGWVGLMTALWLSLLALGHLVAFPVVMVAIPVASMASVAPLPGGLGALDGILIGMLATLPGVGLAGAGAAVVLYRASTYVFPVTVGAVSTSLLTTGTFERL
jgi:uncharacterized protein (TIRG00374 family)